MGAGPDSPSRVAAPVDSFVARNGGAARWRRPDVEASIDVKVHGWGGKDVSANPDSTVLVSADGYESRCSELEELRTVERRRLAEWLAEARQDGDLSDNPALQDLLEEREHLERRISALEAQLAAAEIATPANDGRASIGSVVRVRDSDGATFDYELVGPLESDPSTGRVSIAAPIGQALVGQQAGSRVEVKAPRGPLSLEILAIGDASSTRQAA
jgi:transcription elongation factor GreA